MNGLYHRRTRSLVRNDAHRRGETPVGARGIGEPPVAAGCCAVLNAISAALGDEVFRRAPVNLDGILMALEAGKPMMLPLTANV